MQVNKECLGKISPRQHALTLPFFVIIHPLNFVFICWLNHQFYSLSCSFEDLRIRKPNETMVKRRVFKNKHKRKIFLATEASTGFILYLSVAGAFSSEMRNDAEHQKRNWAMDNEAMNLRFFTCYAKSRRNKVFLNKQFLECFSHEFVSKRLEGLLNSVAHNSYH